MTLQYDIDDLEKGNTPAPFIREGQIYSSHLTGSTKVGKANMTAMRASYSTTFGLHTPDETKVQEFKEVYRKQVEAEQQRLRDAKRQAWKQILFSFRISYLIPQKVKTFIVNLPVMSPKNIYRSLRAEISNIEQGPVSLPVYEERKKICGECPHRMYPEGYHDPLGFCTKCGCGANPRAQLTVKLKLPATSCPLGKWDESPGIYEGLWGRIRYIIKRRFN